MLIKVGKTYSTRGGNRVTIVHKMDMFSANYDMLREYVGDNGLRYSYNGRRDGWGFEQNIDDLVSEAPAQTPTEVLILTIVRNLTDLALRLMRN